MNIDDGNSYKSSIDGLVEDWPENWRSDIFAEPEDQDDFVVAVGRDRVAGQLRCAVGEHHQIPQRNVCRHRKKEKKKNGSVKFRVSFNIPYRDAPVQPPFNECHISDETSARFSLISPKWGQRLQSSRGDGLRTFENMPKNIVVRFNKSTNTLSLCDARARERRRSGHQRGAAGIKPKGKHTLAQTVLFAATVPTQETPPPPTPRLSASWFPPSLSPSAIVTAAGRHKSAAAGLSRSSVRGVPVSILA